MIQDIAPHRLDNSFKNIKAGGNSVVFTFAGGNLLVCDGEDGGIALPTMEQIAAKIFPRGSMWRMRYMLFL